MKDVATASQEIRVEDRPSLWAAVVRRHPGTVIEIRSTTGTESVLYFRRGSEELFLALEHDAQAKSIEDALGAIANMLVCCHHCGNRGFRSSLCRSEYRLLARRLQVFLGVAGYQECVSRAPIHGGLACTEFAVA